MGLPLNLRFGMNRQEYLDTIASVLRQSGLLETESSSPEDELEFDFIFSKLVMHINPVFTKEDRLYQLEMSIKQDHPENLVEDHVRQMVDFYVNNNPNYQSFAKYTIDHEFFFATKGNQLIVPYRSKGLLVFFNVPHMPEDQFKGTTVNQR